jgi:hypothetical protein
VIHILNLPGMRSKLYPSSDHIQISIDINLPTCVAEEGEKSPFPFVNETDNPSACNWKEIKKTNQSLCYNPQEVRPDQPPPARCQQTHSTQRTASHP